MHQLYVEFIPYLQKGDKQRCVQMALDWLIENKIDIVGLYSEILGPALISHDSQVTNGTTSVWEEHLKTSIIRTIIECCYPFIIRINKEKNILQTRGKVVIACPPEELHEIGARMVSDFFTLCGFDATFIGANTPQNDILNVIKYIKPKYVAFSVTNHFNLVAAQSVIRKVLDVKKEPGQDFIVIVGGYAFKHNIDLYKEMGADLFLDSYFDIQKLEGNK